MYKVPSGTPFHLSMSLVRIVLLFGAAGVVWPQETSQASRLTTSKELGAFVDQRFADEMERLHLPGAVFVLVKDGQVFFKKGYGYADLDRKKPVLPDETIFRVGSVTKLFTATAVMQLGESGKLNFNDDVNRYLQLFKLESSFGKPVTIDNLLTHTAGFDEQFIGKGARSGAEIVPLGPYLAKRMPPRIMPPGEFISYSNHGYALLGYVVELISGLPFDEYVERQVLKPLGMMRSSARQPLPSDLLRDLAVGYVYRNGAYQAAPLDYFNDAPAGSLVSTGSDMARFMIAHLEGGRLGDARILNQRSVGEMHRQHFTAHPKLPGVCYGFWEYLANKQRAISHDGGWTGFYSLLFLLPEQHVGFFLATNSLDLQNPSQQDLGEEFIHKFLDRYYPSFGSSPPPQVPGGLREQGADRFTGDYCGRIPPRHTFEKIITLFTQTHVRSGGDGALTVSAPFSDPNNWVHIEPLLFEKTDGRDYMAFRQDEKGQIRHIFTPEVAFRVPWYEAGEVQLGLIALFLLSFLSTLVWPLAYLRRIMTKRMLADVREARLARVLAVLTGTLNVGFLVGFALALQTYPDLVWYGVPAKLTLLLLIPCLTTTLTLGLLVSMWLAWKNRYWSFLHRCHYSVVTLLSVGFVGFLLHWNLLGFHY